jgi:hypothetical protein
MKRLCTVVCDGLFALGLSAPPGLKRRCRWEGCGDLRTGGLLSYRFWFFALRRFGGALVVLGFSCWLVGLFGAALGCLLMALAFPAGLLVCWRRTWLFSYGVGLSLHSYRSISFAPVRGGTYFLCRRAAAKKVGKESGLQPPACRCPSRSSSGNGPRRDVPSHHTR